MSIRESLTEIPLASVEKVRHELDRWLDFAVAQGGRAMEAIGLNSSVHAPAADVIETPEEVCVLINLPGVAVTDIEVTLAGNMLTISGESPGLGVAEDEAVVHRSERVHGKFQRAIPMPASIEQDAVRAETRNGVLTVRLAKLERAKKRQIPVTAVVDEPGESSAPPAST